MASKHQMIGSKALIPIRVFPGNEVDVVSYCPLQWSPDIFVGFAIVYVVDDGCNTDRQEVNVCLVWIHRPEFRCLQLIHEISLHRIYASTGAIVEYWLFSFLVNIHLELFLHFQITPAAVFNSHGHIANVVWIKVSCVIITGESSCGWWQTFEMMRGSNRQGLSGRSPGRVQCQIPVWLIWLQIELSASSPL